MCLVCKFTRAGEFLAGTYQGEMGTSWLPVMDSLFISGVMFLCHQTVTKTVCKD